MHILLTEDELIARIRVMTRGNTIECVLSGETVMGEYEVLMEKAWIN